MKVIAGNDGLHSYYFFYAIFKIFNVFTQKFPIILMSRPQVLIWCWCIFFHSGVHLPSNSVNHVLLLFNLNKKLILLLHWLYFCIILISLKSTSILFSHRTQKMYVLITNKTSDYHLSNNNIIDSVSHLLYSQTEKTVNDRNFSGMFIVSWRKIIEKIRGCDLAT